MKRGSPLRRSGPLRKRGERGLRESRLLESFRRAVLERANGACDRCGSSRTHLHPHHLKMRSQGGSHHPDNGAALCFACHDGVHTHTVPDFADWLVTRKAALA